MSLTFESHRNQLLYAVSSMNLCSNIGYYEIIVISFRTSCRTFFIATEERNENALIYIQGGVKETVTFLC